MRAETSETLRYGLVMLPRQADASAAPSEFVGPPQRGVPAGIRPKLRELREAMARKAAGNHFTDAASAEWASLPLGVREYLYALCEIGAPGEWADLAVRNWQRVPPHERVAITAVIRSLCKHLPRCRALRAMTHAVCDDSANEESHA